MVCNVSLLNSWQYSGCHKYVPFARFPNRKKCSVQRIEIITNMTIALVDFGGGDELVFLEGQDVEENVGRVSREGSRLGQGHIFVSRRLIFFLAVINSSLVRRRRIDIYSANIRYSNNKKSSFSSRVS